MDASYLRLLRDRFLILPLSASLSVGIIFGFVYSFIALWLRQASMPVTWFFGPYALIALFSAFVVMRRAKDKPAPTVVLSRSSR
jgi:hypothetical protein